MKTKLAFLALMMSLSAPAQAQTGSMEDRLRDQLRQSVMQLRDLQNNQASLQAAKLAAEKERDALKAKLAGQSRRPAAAVDAQQLSSLRADNAALERSASESREALERANSEMVRANELIRQLQSEKAQLQTAAAVTADAQAAVEACLIKNKRLIDISNEILSAYENVGFGKVIGAREPFIQAKRVKLENEAQAFGDEIYKAQFRPAHDRARSEPPQTAPLTTDSGPLKPN